ncbi:Hypothetical protein NTJ_01553 [Nesidiocoris tenuis]|uniref:Uncharacterized protein n=1 Tax=Nesidiocoris tenuis TaxID=355587 RepID=A0ABN7A8V8_9HEMI|nr:Hypothetical protein NTJ_01553 [Nesidiocoris tenuis]
MNLGGGRGTEQQVSSSGFPLIVDVDKFKVTGCDRVGVARILADGLGLEDGPPPLGPVPLRNSTLNRP